MSAEDCGKEEGNSVRHRHLESVVPDAPCRADYVVPGSSSLGQTWKRAAEGGQT